VGAGYSSQQKFSFTGSIRQDNVFGSGNYLGVEVNTARTGRALSISTVDPYFTVDGVSRAVDVFYRTTKPINTLGELYEYVTEGGAIRFGVPFSEQDTVFFGQGIELTKISTAKGLPNSYLLYVQQRYPGQPDRAHQGQISTGQCGAQCAGRCPLCADQPAVAAIRRDHQQDLAGLEL
jgi:outer membrane protein insertion porin family